MEKAVVTNSANKRAQATIKLRLARPEDLKIDDDTIKMGYPFWLRSSVDGTFDQRTYFIDQDTDLQEISDWLRLDMIYVAFHWKEEEQ